MTPTELILAFLLAVVIAADVRFPVHAAHFLGSVPGFLVVLGVVYYLFTKSATLGVLALIAGFMVLQQAAPRQADALTSSRVPVPIPQEKAPTFGVTLEEVAVQNIIPMVNNSPNVSFVNSVCSAHNAAAL